MSNWMVCQHIFDWILCWQCPSQSLTSSSVSNSHNRTADTFFFERGTGLSKVLSQNPLSTTGLMKLLNSLPHSMRRVNLPELWLGRIKMMNHSRRTPRISVPQHRFPLNSPIQPRPLIRVPQHRKEHRLRVAVTPSKVQARTGLEHQLALSQLRRSQITLGFISFWKGLMIFSGRVSQSPPRAHLLSPVWL